MSFQKNMHIWNDTVNTCNSFNWKPTKSIKYEYLDIVPEKKFDNTFVNILDLDSIDCGYELLKRGFNPIVLNMADDCFPGGHVQMGSGAQEESLFRRTNYFQTLNLETGYYPLINSQLIYSPQVTIIKNQNGDYLNKYFNLPFIACPAVKKPNLIDNKFSDKDKRIFIQKVKNILNVAYHNNYDSVVLGALGCGAWQCPQEEVANICKQICNDYIGVFKNINFAILEVDKHEYIVKNTNQDRSNLDIFSKVFYG